MTENIEPISVLPFPAEMVDQFAMIERVRRQIEQEFMVPRWMLQNPGSAGTAYMVHCVLQILERKMLEKYWPQSATKAEISGASTCETSCD